MLSRKGDAVPAANFANRTLFHSDNLPILQGMNSETVDLIATDPPFNESRDFHATPESLAAGARFQDRWSWDADVHEEWTDAIQDDYPKVWSVIQSARHSYGDDMGAFLCFMGVRLMEMHRILKPTGSIYLHCDSTAGNYLKMLMDAVFGIENFRNELVWRRTRGRSDAKRFGRVHDFIFYYAKSREFTWNTQYLTDDQAYVERSYRNVDEIGRWRADQLTASGRSSDESGKAWRGVDPSDSGSHWRTPTKGGMNDFIIEHNLIPGWPDAYPSVHQRLDALDAAGLIHWPQKKGGTPSLKRYLDSTKGITVESVIVHLKRLEANSKEKVGYPTQKPLSLYSLFIAASSNPGDMVLDPFCGCATTPIAAERLGRQWVGIDLWEGAADIVKRRLADEGLITDEPTDHLITFGDLTFSAEPPIRTDDGESAAPNLRARWRIQRPTERWQKLTRREIVERLVRAQGTVGGVICGGCGRILEREFMQLDHIHPRAEGGANDISNRILLCAPCNGRKSADLTLRGLTRQNRRVGWTQDADRAKLAQDSARREAERTREELGV